MKAGTYSLTGVKTLQDLLDIINSGKEAQFSVKFIEGKTFKEWRKNLENAPHLKQTLQGKTDKEIMALLDIPAVAKAFTNGITWMDGCIQIPIITHQIRLILNY